MTLDKLKLVREFDTKMCEVRIYESDFEVLNEKLYVISTFAKNNKVLTIRFGNFIQTNSIIRTYYREDMML